MAGKKARIGFTAVKFDPAGPYPNYSGHQLSLGVMDRCEEFCRKIRDAIGASEPIRRCACEVDRRVQHKADLAKIDAGFELVAGGGLGLAL